jgi:hypothetical protein
MCTAIEVSISQATPGNEGHHCDSCIGGDDNAHSVEVIHSKSFADLLVSSGRQLEKKARSSMSFKTDATQTCLVIQRVEGTGQLLPFSFLNEGTTETMYFSK